MKCMLAAAACGLMLLSPVAQSAEIKVLASGAIKEAAFELSPQFEKVSANKVAVTWAGTVDIKKKIAAGEVFDLVIVASPEVDAFLNDGKFVKGSKVDLVKSSVGVAVKAGAPKPDLSSGEAVKKAVLAAKSVGYSTGPSGVYMQTLFEKMGIADQVKAKATITKPGTTVASVIPTALSKKLTTASKSGARNRSHRRQGSREPGGWLDVSLTGVMLAPLCPRAPRSN